MGASESNSATKKIVPFNPTVEVVEKVKYDPHFGEIKIVRDTKTRELYILKEYVVNTKEAFEREVEAFRNRIVLKSPNVVNILGYKTEEKSNFCSTHYKVSLFIEVLEKTLESELEQRQKAKVHYSEHDLLFIAESLISGLAQFQDQKIAHEDIRPFNIFVENKAYKLSDPFISAHRDANALVLAITQRIKTNLAPELIGQVPKKQFEITADRNKADVYSLGITLLSLGTLKNSEEWYDYEKGTINQELIEANLESLRPRYSSFTQKLIRSMLIVDPAQRPVFGGLVNTLAPYRIEIREGAPLPFALGGSPQVERVTRSALPQDTSYTPDDLELRIQAALERSAQTFKTVAARDSYNPAQESKYVEPTYIAPTNTTTTYNYSYVTPSTNDKVVEITTVKETEIVKSSVPQDYKDQTYAPYSFGTVDPVAENKTTYDTTSYKVYSADNYGGLSNSRVAADNYGGLSKSRVGAEDSYANAGTSYTSTYNVTSYEYQPKTEVKTELPVSSQPKVDAQDTYTYQTSSYLTGTSGTGAGTGLAEPTYKYESSALPASDNTYSYSYQTSSYGTGQAGTGLGAEGANYSYTSPYTGTTTTTTTYQYTTNVEKPAELNEIAGLGNLGGDKVSVSYNAIGNEYQYQV